MKSTGDDALDALFKQADNIKWGLDKVKVVEEVLSEPTGVEYVDVSDEPVKKVVDAIQNSGVRLDPNDKKAILIPHLTEQELAENTPAHGKGMVKVRAPLGVSQETFMRLVSNVYALYVTEGSYDNERVCARSGITPGIVAKTLSSPEFKTALRLRGVVPEGLGLTREQELCLQILTDPSDGKTLGQKLKLAGVTYGKYRAWMKNKTFRGYVESLSVGLLHNNVDALVQLERLAGQGDLSAIKYKFELNGTYDPNRQNSIDTMALMGKVLEIITMHVKDPHVLKGVAEDLGAVAKELKVGEIKQIGGT